VKLLVVLSSKPRRYSLPIAFGFALALGFYSGPGLSLPWLLAAAALSALGAALRSLGSLVGGRNEELRGRQALALALGLASGSAVAWNEAGRGTVGFEIAPAKPVAATSGRAAARAGALAPSTVPLVPLQPAWVEGRLATDSSPAKNGFRSYSITIERLGLAGGGFSAELYFPGAAGGGALRILARAGPLIDSGCLLRARGSARPEAEASSSPRLAAAPVSTPALFAAAKDLDVRDRGTFLCRLRSRLREACSRALGRVGKRSSGLLQALILGVRDSLAPDEAEAFRAAGCSHILALSGEHLSVLALLAIAVLKPLAGPARARLGGALLASLFMWIAGPGPSLLRAVLMAWVGAIALALDRPQDWLATLALSLIVSLPLDPVGAKSLSFTLSYLAVWGLAVLAPRCAFLLGRLLPPFLREPASASLAAQAAVSPLLAVTFGYLQFAGIAASMAAGPIVMLLMWWGMGAALFCSLLPQAAPLAAQVSDLLYTALMLIMKTAASVPVLPLPGLGPQLLASLAIGGLVALVYARPYAEYRASGAQSLARLRFAPGPQSPPRGRGLGYVQALRPELPGE
jgi:ComEC/Rec2-related protein